MFGLTAVKCILLYVTPLTENIVTFWCLYQSPNVHYISGRQSGVYHSNL